MGRPVNAEDSPHAVVTGLFVGTEQESFVTHPVGILTLDQEGIVGEPRQKRRGLVMPADVRTRGVRKGTVVPHQQHVSIIDEPSLTTIADALRIDEELVRNRLGLSRVQFLAGCMGANLVVSQIEPGGLYDVPNGSVMGRLDDEGYFETAVQISRYNSPCIHPGRAIAERYPDPSENMAADFVRIAESCRGVVAGVYVAGSLSVGDTVAFVPRQTN